MVKHVMLWLNLICKRNLKNFYKIPKSIMKSKYKMCKGGYQSKRYLKIITFYSILISSLIDNEQPKARSSTGMDWENFHTLDEIYEWLDVIAQRYPDIVTPFDIGYSYEGRLIKGIKISYKPGNKAVFIESNIHAREWITSATITYIIDELLVPRNPGVRKIAESVDWWIIPVLNVDGFVYSHEVVSNFLGRDKI